MEKVTKQKKSAKSKAAPAALPTNAGYGANDPKGDDLAKNTEDSVGEYLTTNQGVRIEDNQNSLKAGDRGRLFWKTLSCAKRSLISITNEFQNG